MPIWVYIVIGVVCIAVVEWLILIGKNKRL
jgi:hypothetical protein